MNPKALKEITQPPFPNSIVDNILGFKFECHMQRSGSCVVSSMHS